MYRILNGETAIASSALEAGDPPMGSVSGILLEIDDIHQFTKMLLDCGATNDNGMFHLELSEKFSVVNNSGDKLQYSGGAIFSVPEVNEATIDLVGISYPEYEELFPNHVLAYADKYKNT